MSNNTQKHYYVDSELNNRIQEYCSKHPEFNISGWIRSKVEHFLNEQQSKENDE